MNELQKVFNFSGVDIRTVVVNDEPWFVANDVCNILDLENSRKALTRISDKNKGVSISDTLGGKQEVAIVNEPGLYKLIFTSRKAEAEQFQDWIYEEVLPSIRKTGKYNITQKLSNQLLGTIDQKLYKIITDKTKTTEQAENEVNKIIEQITHTSFMKIMELPHVKINKLADFINDLCEFEDDYEIDLTVMYDAYFTWCVNRDQKPLSKMNFKNCISEHDEIAYLKANCKHGFNARFAGVRLLGG